MVTLKAHVNFCGYFAGSFSPAPLSHRKRIDIVEPMPTAHNSMSAEARVPFALAWVFLGGALGSVLRFALLLNGGFILISVLSLLAVNTVGSFLLGLLTGWLSHTADSPRTQRLRLLLGTGMLGGFTSYSTLTLVTSQLLSSSLLVASLFGFGSLLLGLFAAWLGLAIGRAITVRHEVQS